MKALMVTEATQKPSEIAAQLSRKTLSAAAWAAVRPGRHGEGPIVKETRSQAWVRFTWYSIKTRRESQGKHHCLSPRPSSAHKTTFKRSPRNANKDGRQSAETE